MDQKTVKKIKKEVKEDIEQKLAKSKVDSDLINIYTNGNGEIDDVSKIEVKKTNYLRNFLIIFSLIILFLVGAAWLGFFIFSGNGNFGGKSLVINIRTEKEVVSGQEITYIIEYTNKENFALKNVEVTVIYPDGFTFAEAYPKPDNTYDNIFKIGDLIKKEQGQIRIKGKIIGEIGDLANLQVTFVFQPENFSSIFRESYIETIQITSSILTIEMEGPTETLPEKKINYRIKYKNTSDQSLEDIQLVAIYPENFIFQEANPLPSRKPGTIVSESNENEKNNVWYFKKIESGGEEVIDIFGGFVANGKAEEEFEVELGVLDEDGSFSLQQKGSILTKVVNHNFKLSLIVNGSIADKAINFGDTLNYSIVYKNLGQETLKDIAITAVLNSDVLDWETLIDKNTGRVGIREIVWDKESVSSLAQLSPLDEGSIDFSIRVKDLEKVKVGNVNLGTNSLVRAVIGKVDKIEAGVEVETEKITNNINTTLELRAEGRYFNDDNIAVGTGPLPPVVGQKTTFRIYWYLANNLHEAKNVIINTKLPPGVQWENKFLETTGKISYSVADNTVVWEIPKIPPQKDFEDVNVWFDVSVTPTKDQVGKLILLATETNLIATDSETESSIVQMERSITSNLEEDLIGGGRGLVVDIN